MTRPPAAAVSLLLGALALSVGWTGCGRTVPHGGEAAAPRPPDQPARVVGTDLIPADLDLVLRVDLARVRNNLGPEPSRELSRRALDQADPDAVVRAALERADVVWVGLRLSDALAGDRVVVVESAAAPTEPDPVAWSPVPSSAEEVRIFDAILPPRRSGTARIVRIGDDVTVFVSPVEIDSVARVLRQGPDPGRGEPAARGLISLDWRTKRPSVQMQNRFPSLAALLRGVVRVRATVTLHGDHLLLEGRMQCRHEPAAAKALRFLQTFVDTARMIDRYRAVLKSLALSRAGTTIRVRWPVPPELVLALVRGPDSEPAPDAATAAPEAAEPAVAPPTE